MGNEEILHHLGLCINWPSRIGNDWVRAEISDVPSSLREWAKDELVRLMQEGNSPAYVWKVRP